MKIVIGQAMAEQISYHLDIEMRLENLKSTEVLKEIDNSERRQHERMVNSRAILAC